MRTKRTADAARWTAVAVGIPLTSIVMGVALMAFVGTEPRLTTPKPAIVHPQDTPPKNSELITRQNTLLRNRLEQRRNETLLVVIAAVQIAFGAVLLALSVAPPKETRT